MSGTYVQQRHQNTLLYEKRLVIDFYSFKIFPPFVEKSVKVNGQSNQTHKFNEKHQLPPAHARTLFTLQPPFNNQIVEKCVFFPTTSPSKPTGVCFLRLEAFEQEECFPNAQLTTNNFMKVFRENAEHPVFLSLPRPHF